MGKYIGYTFGLEMPERRLLARVSRVERLPASLGSAASTAGLAAKARTLTAFPTSEIAKPRQITDLLKGFAVDRVRVRDVGQASFATLLGATDEPLVHFDAGWPTGFNWRGTPKTDPDVLGTNTPIILSHWDWDHLHAWHRVSELRDRNWITPVQDVGPGARLVMEALAAKGLLYGVSKSMNLGWGQLGVCSGTAGNHNQTGLALLVTLTNGRNILLVGDADYDMTPPALRASPLHGLVVTHHGALFHGAVPSPAYDRAPAIISCGQGNVYRHPRKAAIFRHTGLQGRKWTIQRTATIGLRKRGDRWLL